MDTNDVNIKIDESKEYNKKILIVQNFIRKTYTKKMFYKFKEKVYKIIDSPDTVRITPGKFVQPLYLVQQPLLRKCFGKKIWYKYYNFITSNYVYFIIIFYLLGSTISFLYLFNFYTNILSNIISISFILPFYLSYILIFEDQLLILAFSSLECKLYFLVSIISCIILSDLFSDLRIFNVWLVSFPGFLIIPLSDSIPKYLKKMRRMFMFYLCANIIYNFSLIFGLTFGHISVYNRKYEINSKLQNNNEVSISTLTYTRSLLETLTMLNIKNLIWYFLNTHRGIIIKSPVLITSLRDYKLPKKNMEKRKSFLQKKNNFKIQKKSKSFHIDKNKSKNFSQTTIHYKGDVIERVHFKPQFALFNNI